MSGRGVLERTIRESGVSGSRGAAVAPAAPAAGSWRWSPWFELFDQAATGARLDARGFLIFQGVSWTAATLSLVILLATFYPYSVGFAIVSGRIAIGVGLAVLLHRIYNSLNSVVAEKGDPGKVESLVLSLAGYLRFSLQEGPGLAPLGKELDALENYLQVEKIRFEEKLEYQVVAAAAARAHQVPNALVLPLHENAVKYGQLTSGWPLCLGISARLEAGEMVIGVANSGRWIEPGVSGGSGIGLANLRRRLELLYGGKARLEVVEGDGQIEVQVRLPADFYLLPP
jgi:hypothetical protein